MRISRFRAMCASFLVVALAACACTRERPSAPAPSPGDVRVHVDSVGFDRGSSAHYVLLADGSRRRAVPILIGESEARAISLELHGIKAPRPLTHDLMREILRTTGTRVDWAVIYGVREGVFYARISLDGGRHTVDARPSDAIALALGMHAPIYVKATLLQLRSSLSLGRTGALPRNARGLGLTVQEITPTLARYFKLDPGSGLLISAADATARDAGAQVGDIVTAIGGKSVKRLSDFDNEISGLREGEKVTLTVRRDGAERSITLEASSPGD